MLFIYNEVSEQKAKDSQSTPGKAETAWAESEEEVTDTGGWGQADVSIQQAFSLTEV